MSILLFWNQRINLTSVTEPRQILARHFGESFFAIHTVPIEGGRLADFGSGAGFPWLALKVGVPQLEVSLVETIGNKAAFLSEVSRQLGLTGVEVLRCRFQETGLRRHSLDYVSARAVGNVGRIVETAHGLLKPTGGIVLWLGEREALRMAKTKGWSWRDPLLIPGSQRRVLLIGRPVVPN
jgi:16S rRNA (guanine527-N7)-methyltransferase